MFIYIYIDTVLSFSYGLSRSLDPNSGRFLDEGKGRGKWNGSGGGHPFWWSSTSDAVAASASVAVGVKLLHRWPRENGFGLALASDFTIGQHVCLCATHSHTVSRGGSDGRILCLYYYYRTAQRRRHKIAVFDSFYCLISVTRFCLFTTPKYNVH